MNPSEKRTHFFVLEEYECYHKANIVLHLMERSKTWWQDQNRPLNAIVSHPEFILH